MMIKSNSDAMKRLREIFEYNDINDDNLYEKYRTILFLSDAERVLVSKECHSLAGWIQNNVPLNSYKYEKLSDWRLFWRFIWINESKLIESEKMPVTSTSEPKTKPSSKSLSGAEKYRRTMIIRNINIEKPTQKKDMMTNCEDYWSALDAKIQLSSEEGLAAFSDGFKGDVEEKNVATISNWISDINKTDDILYEHGLDGIYDSTTDFCHSVIFWEENNTYSPDDKCYCSACSRPPCGVCEPSGDYDISLANYLEKEGYETKIEANKEMKEADDKVERPLCLKPITAKSVPLHWSQRINKTGHRYCWSGVKEY